MAVILLAVLVVGITAMALANPLFFRMALRNTVRRPLQAFFSVAGLGVSAVMIVGAFAMGDTLGYSLQDKVTNQLGNIRLTITRNAAPGQPAPYFSVADGIELQSKLQGVTLVPTIAEVVTAQAGDQVIAGTTLLGLPSTYEKSLGSLRIPDGGEAPLSDLTATEIYVTTKTAGENHLRAGDVLRFELAGQRHEMTIKAIVTLPGWIDGGAGLVAPLERVQGWRAVNQQANVLLAVTPGSSQKLAPGTASAIARETRLAVVSPNALQDVMHFLTDQERMQKLESAYAHLAPNTLLYPRVSRLVQALRQQNGSDAATYLDEPDVRMWLLGLPLSEADQASLVQSLERLSTYHVDDTRASALVTADLEAQNTTTMFAVFGFFAVFAGFMLIFLMVSLLMADRKREMGIFRAVGAKQRHVWILLFLETCVYSVLGSALGIAVGAVVARVMVGVLAAGYGDSEAVRFHLTPSSLLNAFAFSFLLNTGVSVFAALRTRRLDIVTATRGLPEPDHPVRQSVGKPGFVSTLMGLLVRGAVGEVGTGILPLGVGVLCINLGRSIQHATPLVLGYSLAAIGVVLVLRALLRRFLPGYRAVVDGIAFSVGGLGLLALWAVPSSTIRYLGAGNYRAGIELFLVAGVLEVLGAFWLFRYSIRLVSSVAALPARLFRRLAAPSRLAEAALTSNSSQTAVTVAMISLIAFVLTTMFVVTSAMGGLRDHPEIFTRGFDIRVDLSRPLPTQDARAALSASKAEDMVSGGGGRVDLPILVRQVGVGDGSWSSYQAVTGTSDYFATVSQHGGRLLLRSSDYRSDQEVWDALQSGAPVALITGDAVVVRQRFDVNAQAGPFSLAGFYLEDGALPDVHVQIKVPGENQIKQLRVVGVVQAVGNDAGIITNLSNLNGLLPYELQPSKYYITVGPGHKSTDVANALNADFKQFGAKATVLTRELDATMNEVESTNGVLSGFAGLGLFVGVAALGILSARAVSQRRQQIGMVRALGFQRSMVVISFLMEAVVICAVGLAVGAALGLALSGDLIRTVNKVTPVMRFAPPWIALSAYLLGAFVFTLLVSGSAALQAARVHPAEALRYE